MDRNEVFAELAKRGVAQAVVAFSGGGDEGGVDDISLVDAEGVEIGKVEEESGCTFNVATGLYTHKPKSDDGALAEALSEPVDERFGSFAGDFSVHGTVVWDVAEESVTICGDVIVDEWFLFEEEV